MKKKVIKKNPTGGGISPPPCTVGLIRKNVKKVNLSALFFGSSSSELARNLKQSNPWP